MSRFQVIIPVLNDGKTLLHTLQTLAELPNDNVSFLISNICSTDSTPEILEDSRDRDSRFQIIKTKQTLPLKDSLEFAMSQSSGDYLMVIGSEDGLYTGCIEVAEEALRHHPQAKAVAHRRSFLPLPDAPDHCGTPGFPPSATGAELDTAPYVVSSMPLAIGTYSAHSSALSFFSNTKDDAAGKKLSLELTAEKEKLVFTSKCARGSRYGLLKLVLQHWPNASFTERELDLSHVCGMWEGWKHRHSMPAEAPHQFAYGTQHSRQFIDRTAANAGLTDLIADLDRNYVFHGDNSALWTKWGTSFQQDADSFAKIIADKRLANGPKDSPAPRWESAGFAAISKACADSLQPLQKDNRNLGRQVSKFSDSWRAPKDASWALKTGLSLARFPGKAPCPLLN